MKTGYRIQAFFAPQRTVVTSRQGGASPEAGADSGRRPMLWLIVLTVAIALTAGVAATWVHFAAGTDPPGRNDAAGESRVRQADAKKRSPAGPGGSYRGAGPVVSNRAAALAAEVDHGSAPDPADDPGVVAPELGAMISASQPDLADARLRRCPDLSRQSKLPATEGQTLLHIAILRKDIRLADMLLAAGADVNLRDVKGRTVLDVAVEAMPDQTDLIRTLLARRVEGEIGNLYKALDLLLTAGRAPAVNKLLPLALDIDSQRDDKGFGLIHFAAMAGNKAMIDLLLAHGVDLKITTWEGATPLHVAVAATTAPAEMTAALLAGGAEVNMQDLFDRTPLYIAAAEGVKPAVLKLLLDAGAKVDLRGDRRNSPLLLAAGRGDRENVKLLLDYKADPNQQDQEGKTVLHYAAIKGDLELAKIVLAAGAGTRLRDGSRNLARVVAVNMGHPEVSDFILDVEAARIKAAGSQPDRPVFPEDTPKRPKKEPVRIK